MHNTVTYLIFLHNNAQDLQILADSIKNINCDLSKEYIIIDDASTDNTKAIAQRLFAALPRVTIVSNSIYSGPAFSINNVMHLIQGEYIHFVFGGQILEPFSTTKLIHGCKAFGTELAFGMCGTIDELGNKYKNSASTGDAILIDVPIKAALENKIVDIRRVGYSGTLMTKGLLQKIAGVDMSIFLHNMSLLLRAGKYSKFVAVQETLYYGRDSIYDRKFEEYDNLCAISNFIEAYWEIAECYKPEIYKALWSILWHLDRYNIKTLPRYLLSRYLSKNLDLQELVALYREYVDKLS